MLCEEMAKVTILSCKWEQNNKLNRKFLNTKAIITIRSNNYSLTNQKFTTIKTRLDIYGDEEELKKVPYELQARFDSGKKGLMLYLDIHLAYSVTFIPNSFPKPFIRFTCCDFKLAKTKLVYLKQAKVEEKSGYAKAYLLEKQLQKELKQQKAIVITQKKKVERKKGKLSSAKQENYELEVVENIDIFEEEEMQNEEISEAKEKEEEKEAKQNKKNTFDFMFGETKW